MNFGKNGLKIILQGVLIGHPRDCTPPESVHVEQIKTESLVLELVQLG